MNLSRMEFADFGNLDRMVEEIHRQIPTMAIPVPVAEIARQLDIAEIRTLETEGFEGGLITDRERSTGVILVNETSRPERQRYTIGHELGHFLSPWHEPGEAGKFLCSSEDMRRASHGKSDRYAEMEVQANRFSAQLLLPKTKFLRDLKPKAGVAIEHVLELSHRYQVSKEATARRYVDLRGEPCAAVVSHNGVVRRLYRNSDFPYIDVQPGQPVPRGSQTARTDLPMGEASDCEETEGGLWISVRHGHRAPPMYEQVLPQANGYRLTMLSLDEGASEEEAEDEDLRETWTPRFRR